MPMDLEQYDKGPNGQRRIESGESMQDPGVDLCGGSKTSRTPTWIHLPLAIHYVYRLIIIGYETHVRRYCTGAGERDGISGPRIAV